MTETDPVQALLARAFETVPAAQANEAIARVRAEQGSDQAEALSYEVVLPLEGALQALTARVLPRLIYFLDSRGARAPHWGAVVVSLFHGDRLYFLQAHEVIDALCALSGLSPAQLVEKYGAASV